MQKNISIIISIIGALLLAGGFFFYMQIIELKSNAKDRGERDFQFITTKGEVFHIKTGKREFKIEEMKGKIVFLKIFGWDCEFCKKEIPQLIKLKKSLPDTFDILAIEAQKHTDAESEAYIKKLGINYNVVSGTTHKDFYSYLQKEYGWTGIIPVTIVLSKEGYVLAFEIGSKSYSLSGLLKASLEKK